MEAKPSFSADGANGSSTADTDKAVAEGGRWRGVLVPIREYLGANRELPRDVKRERRRRSVGFSLLTIGACFLLFLGYLFAFTGFQEQRIQRQLLNVFETPAGAVPLSGRVPADGQPAAVLEIPTIHLTQVVVQGTTAGDLMKGPGIVPNTARPGTKGNAVIAGRRYTGGAVFSKLSQLVPGDRITLINGLGKFHYRVEYYSTASPGQRSPVSPVKRGQLTLLTSQSLAGTGLFFVVAPLVSPAGSAPRPAHPPTVVEQGLSGDPGAWGPTILWGLLLALCLIGSFMAYGRAKERVWTIYLLTVPIVLAVALEWFSFVYRLLPATM